MDLTVLATGEKNLHVIVDFNAALDAETYNLLTTGY